MISDQWIQALPWYLLFVWFRKARDKYVEKRTRRNITTTEESERTRSRHHRTHSVTHQVQSLVQFKKKKNPFGKDTSLLLHFTLCGCLLRARLKVDQHYGVMCVCRCGSGPPIPTLYPPRQNIPLTMTSNVTGCDGWTSMNGPVGHELTSPCCVAFTRTLVCRNLQAVVTQLSDNARELSDLQTKVETRHAHSLDERETAAKARDEQLKSKFHCQEMLFFCRSLKRSQCQMFDFFGKRYKRDWRGSNTKMKWSDPDFRVWFRN